jgi:hypothetical protein
MGGGKTLSMDVQYEREKYPEDLEERDIELHAAQATRLHMLDLVGAIADRRRPVADVQEGHISTASCILANISMKLDGRPLVYDPIKKKVVGDRKATRLLARTYRRPYERPEITR